MLWDYDFDGIWMNIDIRESAPDIQYLKNNQNRFGSESNQQLQDIS